MVKRKCQVCDGPVVNGRCKWCGMPYRNDDILYHLNEDRSEHYRHATPGAIEELRRRETPLGDRPGAGTYGRNQGASGKKTGNAGQRQPDYGKREKMAGSGRSTAGGAGRGTGYTTAKSGGSASETKKSTKPFLIVALIFLLTAVVPNVIEFVKDNYDRETESLFQGNSGAELSFSMYMTKDDAIEVGAGELSPGKYRFSINAGYAAVEVKRDEEWSEYYLNEATRGIDITLRKGDVVAIHNVDKGDRWVEVCSKE